MRGITTSRAEPFSQLYGTDRGRPIDRVYIDAFIRRHRADVRGQVLEVQSDRYASATGGARVDGLTIVDVRPENPHATLVADLCTAGSLEPGRYDCIIATQTLQYLDDVPAAVGNMWQALAPHGVMLLTVPAIARLDPYDHDWWRWVPAGLERQLRSSLPPGADIAVEGHGNAIAGAAYFTGLAVEDVDEARLSVDDPSFPVTICARVARP